MNRTINMVIGIFFTVIFFGFAISRIPQLLYQTEDTRMGDISTFIQGDNLIVTWTTEEKMRSRVEYSVGIVRDYVDSTEYTINQRVQIDVSGLVGPITLNAFSCDVTGRCENKTIIEII